MQFAHTRRRDLIAAIARRLSAAPARPRKISWLFPDLVPQTDLQIDAPSHLSTTKKRAWARRHYDEALNGRYQAITDALKPGAKLSASHQDGELVFEIDGIAMIDRVFVSPEDAPYLLAQWQYVASTLSITPSTPGKRLCDALRKLASDENLDLVGQVLDLQSDLMQTEQEIIAAEAEMNRLVYDLYEMSDEHIAHIQRSLIRGA